MDELVKLVATKTGIPEATARTAVETVVNYLKQKLPAPLAAQVDAALANDQTAKQAGDLIEGLGGLLKQR